MTSYLNVQRTFCPVLKSESFTPTCWPDISNVTQCPNPEIAIYLEECNPDLFVLVVLNASHNFSDLPNSSHNSL